MARRCVSGCFIVKHILKPVNTEKKRHEEAQRKKNWETFQKLSFSCQHGGHLECVSEKLCKWLINHGKGKCHCPSIVLPRCVANFMVFLIVFLHFCLKLAPDIQERIKAFKECELKKGGLWRNEKYIWKDFPAEMCKDFSKSAKQVPSLMNYSQVHLFSCLSLCFCFRYNDQPHIIILQLWNSEIDMSNDGDYHNECLLFFLRIPLNSWRPATVPWLCARMLRGRLKMTCKCSFPVGPRVN